MKRYQISSKTITYAHKDVFIITVLLVVIFYWLRYGLTEDEIKALNFGAGLSLIAFAAFEPIPVWILLFDYLRNGDAKTVAILTNEILIEDRRIVFEEIRKVRVFATIQHFDGYGGVSTLAYNPYFYYMEFHLVSGEQFILTSLLGYPLHRDLKKVLGEEKFEKVIRAFPLIEKNNKEQGAITKQP